jgi:hypothetical protein
MRLRSRVNKKNAEPRKMFKNEATFRLESTMKLIVSGSDNGGEMRLTLDALYNLIGKAPFNATRKNRDSGEAMSQ